MFDHNAQSAPIGGLHVAELARLAGVTPATIRYYSRIGLLSPKREPDNGYRCFSAADRHRVRFIRRAQSLGLTIDDIKAIFASIDQGEVPCDQVRTLVERRLKSVRQQLEKLAATEARIDAALSTWEDMSESLPAEGELCPLIDRVDSGEAAKAASASVLTTHPRPAGSGSSGTSGFATAHC